MRKGELKLVALAQEFEDRTAIALGLEKVARGAGWSDFEESVDERADALP
jgi:hypothetical protein